ncbi:hypothetical protein OROGR_020954 [Orobanche gracilis]
MDAGLRFPLPYAVSHLLAAWNVAPLQLASNAWLQIICTFTLFGLYRLYRHLSPWEMNILFKLAAQRGSVGSYHVQSRSGRVVSGLPNKVRGDLTKWFWVAGAWKSTSSENPDAEVDIPTGFQEKSPIPIVPAVHQIPFDFALVRHRLKSLRESALDVQRLNTEDRRLAARLFRFPRHLQEPDISFPAIPDPFSPEMKKASVVLSRAFRRDSADQKPLSPPETKLIQTLSVQTVAPPPEKTLAPPPPPPEPTQNKKSRGPDRSERQEEGALLHRPKKQRTKDPRESSSGPRESASKHKLMETKEKFLADVAAEQMDITRGHPYFGRDPARAHAYGVETESRVSADGGGLPLWEATEGVFNEAADLLMNKLKLASVRIALVGSDK